MTASTAPQPDDWLGKLLFSFSWDTHLVKAENHSGKLTDEQAIEKYQKLYAEVEDAIRSRISEAEAAAKKNGFYIACGVTGIPMERASYLWEKCLAELYPPQANTSGRE